MAVKVKKEISLEKQYNFPSKLTIISYKNHYLVISDNTSNYLVLDSQQELDFFHLLQENPLKKAIKSFHGSQKDIQNVIIQIEAKNFENTIVKPSNRNVIFIYLTNACNLRCPHCYMSSGKASNKELSTDEILAILQNAKKHNIEYVTFSGGEITTRKDLFKIIQYANDLKFKIQLFSNGTQWTEDLIKKVAPLIHKVQISIDGYSEEENSLVRGKGNFKKSLATIEKFLNLGVETDLACTPLYNDNLVKNKNNYIEFGKRLISKYENLPFNIIFTGELLEGRKLSLSESAKIKYSNIMDEISSAVYGNRSDLALINHFRNHDIISNCAFGTIVVAADGNIYLCAQIPRLKPVANIRSDNFDKIMEISQKASFLSDITHLRPCKDCELKFICGGGCKLIYFNQLSKCDFETIDDNYILPRSCTQKIKETWYDLMIKINKYTYQ